MICLNSWVYLIRESVVWCIWLSVYLPVGDVGQEIVLKLNVTNSPEPCLQVYFLLHAGPATRMQLQSLYILDIFTCCRWEHCGYCGMSWLCWRSISSKNNNYMLEL